MSRRSVSESVRNFFGCLPRTGMYAGLLVGLLAVAVGLSKYGLSPYSGWGNLFHVTQNYLQPQLDPSQDFILPNSGFSAFLGWVGVDSPQLWMSIQLSLVVAALVTPFLLVEVREHAGRLRVMFVILVGGPILPVLLEWVGSYDALTVLGLTIGAIARRALFRITGWLLVGFSHAELGIVALALLVAYRFVNDVRQDRFRNALRCIIFSLPPLLVTWAFTSVMVSNWGGATSRLALALANPLDNAYKFALVMPAMLFSVLGVLWLVLLRPRELHRKRSWSLVLIVGGMSLVLPFFLHDHTRVLGILSFPLVLSWILLLTERQAQGMWRRFSVAACVIPIPVFVAGTVMLGGLINFLTWRSLTA